MAASAAKMEANRRNAQKSTGPRTEEGKKRSKMNASNTASRAETLVLPEEDPRELEERRAAWTASLGPRCELSSGPSTRPSCIRGVKTGRGGPKRPGLMSGWLTVAPAKGRRREGSG